MTFFVEIPEEMRERVEAAARGRGESADDLVREAITTYLEELEDAQFGHTAEAHREAGRAGNEWSEFEDEVDSLMPHEQVAREKMLAQLAAARSALESSGESWLSWEDIEHEIAEQRGSYDDPDLP